MGTTDANFSSVASEIAPVEKALRSVNDRTKQAVEKSTRLAQECSELAKSNIEALLAASKVAASGFKKFRSDAAEYGRSNLDNVTAAITTLASVKSPAEFFEWQSAYARSAFGNMLDQSAKLNDAVIELGTQIASPIATRYVATAERVKVAVFER